MSGLVRKIPNGRYDVQIGISVCNQFIFLIESEYLPNKCAQQLPLHEASVRFEMDSDQNG